MLLQVYDSEVQQVLCRALEEISLEKQYQEKCLLMLVQALQSYKEYLPDGKRDSDAERLYLFSKYQLMVSSVLMASLPRHFPSKRVLISWLCAFKAKAFFIISNSCVTKCCDRSLITTCLSMS